jgi:hypothetical protein
MPPSNTVWKKGGDASIAVGRNPVWARTDLPVDAPADASTRALERHLSLKNNIHASGPEILRFRKTL